MEDGGFDDPIEPEDPTDVNKKKIRILISFIIL
jgi:hypothetical protein